MTKVFVVEDDVSLRQELTTLLEHAGFQVISCSSFVCVADQILDVAPDAVILDLKLPESDGLSIAYKVRKESSVPLLMLTSSDQEFDEVMSIKMGVDDYITKPYRAAVLLARLEAVLKRHSSQSTSTQILRHRGLMLDAARSQVTYLDSSIELTRNESHILWVLLSHAGEIVSRQDLMCELWQSDAFVDDNTLTVNVNRLRKSLESIGVPADFLTTHRGQGYRT